MCGHNVKASQYIWENDSMKFFWIALVLFVVELSACKSNTSPQKINEVEVVEEELVVNLLEDLSATTDIRKLLAQNWEHKEDAEDAEAAGSGGSIEMPYRGLDLCTDGALTENPRGNMRLGKWSYDELKKTVHFNFTPGGQATYKIGAIGPLQLILLNLADNKKQFTGRMATPLSCRNRILFTLRITCGV
jgi:hypothetical protein